LATKTFYNTDPKTKRTGTLALTGDSAVGDVLSGKTFYKDNAKTKLTGTMTNNGTVSTDISAKATEVTIAQGYHSGSGKVKISATEQAKIIAGNIKAGITLLGVAGKSSVVDTADANAVAGDILSGKTGYVNGSKITGTFPVYTAGTHIIAYSDKQKSSYGSSDRKVKEITIKSAGVYRIYFTLTNTRYFEAYGRIYKNGVAYGTQRSIIPPFGEIITQEFTQDLSFAANDLVQIYVRANGDGYVYTENFRIGVAEIINIPVVNDAYN
jgi:hypothetical protein